MKLLDFVDVTVDGADEVDSALTVSRRWQSLSLVDLVFFEIESLVLTMDIPTAAQLLLSG